MEVTKDSAPSFEPYMDAACREWNSICCSKSASQFIAREKYALVRPVETTYFAS